MRIPIALLLLTLAACRSDLPDATVLERRGADTLAKGHAAEAQEIFKQALLQDQDSFLAAVGLARSSLRLRDWQRFQSAQKRAQDIAPPEPAAYELLARTLLEAAQLVKGSLRREYAAIAARYLVGVSREEGDFPRLSYHLALTHYLAERPRAAIPFLKRALLEEPDFTPAREAMALCLEGCGELSSLRNYLEKLAKEDLLTPRLEKTRARLAESKTKTNAKAP